MPIHFITDEGYGITNDCREYLAPLIRGEDYPPYCDNGMPKYITVSKKTIEKKLNTRFDI